MFFLNLTGGEFLTLLTALGGLITALYLLDRAKRKKVVSTLRFWTPALTSEQRQNRRRMREPWSLVLQLLSLLLLLLAVGQLQWGSRESRERDHVLILDTSAWTDERADGLSVLDREKANARIFLKSVPARDRIMLVRADGLTVPVTPFTTDRGQVLAGINESVPGFTGLNLQQALSFANQAREWSTGAPGETIYIGPRMVSSLPAGVDTAANLRVISVDATRENCGIRRINVKRHEEEPNTWQATITVKNYASRPKVVRLRVQFAGTVFSTRALSLGPGQEGNAEYDFVTNTAGQLIADLETGIRNSSDVLASDNRATLQLPRIGLLKVAVYTARPKVLKPLLEANHRLSVNYLSPAAYVDNPAADLMVLDGIAPRQPPAIPSLWIDPDRLHSPLPVKDLEQSVQVKNWNAESGLGAGLHTKDAIAETEVFQTFAGDVPVAAIADGPIVVARPADPPKSKFAVIGFDPLAGDLRFSVTTPLLFANLLRWLSPESFRTVEVAAERVGSASLTLDPAERPDQLKVSDEKGFAIPFTFRQQTLQLFVSHPSLASISSGDRQRILSLTLPDVTDEQWAPPATAKTGMPAAFRLGPAALDIWQWLAALGAIGLIAEWMLFGRQRVARRRSGAGRETLGRFVNQPDRELVSK